VRHIVAERISEDAELRKLTRHLMFEEGGIQSRRCIDSVDEQEKFKMYFLVLRKSPSKWGFSTLRPPKRRLGLEDIMLETRTLGDQNRSGSDCVSV
jgi:hypothetical protein